MIYNYITTIIAMAYYQQSTPAANKFIKGMGNEEKDRRPRTEAHLSVADVRGMDHAMKRYNYFDDLRKANGQPIPTFALTEYDDAVEKRVRDQVQAYATHREVAERTGFFPANARPGVDTSTVPNVIYFPAPLWGGLYMVSNDSIAQNFGANGPTALPIDLQTFSYTKNGGKKSHRKKGGKKSHRKKGGKRSHRRRH
jgi:hypothetical protein